jgi:salicylate hydroxylase
MLTRLLARLRQSWFPPSNPNRHKNPNTNPRDSVPVMLVADEPLQIAVVGCGIIGAILALGLINKNIKVTVYEQARSLREIGAGIAFTANARKCMSMIDERIVDCIATVATPNGDPKNPNNNMQFIDGYTHDPGDPDDISSKKLYKLFGGPKGFEGCHRAHFLEEIMKLMPNDVVRLSKRLHTLEDYGAGKVVLRFCDGTVAQADAGKLSIFR